MTRSSDLSSSWFSLLSPPHEEKEISPHRNLDVETKAHDNPPRLPDCKGCTPWDHTPILDIPVS